ncbi:cysteine desulfurase-like protein [Marinibactrum halimedae]|uniref:Cysteine desulfurase-like protein n=2 Tax=Marinibactrum halimedae TaxID=1444977 RepID=A0AA37T9L8_9GAMM|nr:aminotransferase class V-fold PLP-dependent enzyme [Marinibactrum halimedae]GLS27392.1 cysteine desulfurase-like protein [Marinibactrum halimedae]
MRVSGPSISESSVRGHHTRSDQEQTELNVDFVRQQFPIFSHQDTPLAFFDNAGGTFVPQQVIEATSEFLSLYKVQPYSSNDASQGATTRLEGAIGRMADFINAKHSEVVLGNSTTMNLSMLAQSLRPHFHEGDEIILTEQEHQSNVTFWQRLAEETGAKVVTWPIDGESGQLSLEVFSEQCLSEKTKLCCVTHSSNIVGTVNPIKTIAEKVHAVGGWILVDGVSYAPHHCVDVQALGVDFYVLSLYKIFSTHLGLLYVKESLHNLLENQNLTPLPSAYGCAPQGGQQQNNAMTCAPNYLRIALNPGMTNPELAASMLGMCEYFLLLYQHHFPQEVAIPLSELSSEAFRHRVERVFTLIERYETELSKKFLAYIKDSTLNSMGLRLIGLSITDSSRRSPTFSFRLPERWNGKVLVAQLAEHNIGVSFGSFYAWDCLQALGLPSEGAVLRVSFSHYNHMSDIERLIEALEVYASEQLETA